MKIHYHSDHLGSASFVTDRGGNVVQHLQYLPYGELFVSQRNSEEFYSRYKFTAKELDNETSYTYFGARYYDSELRGWLSMNSNEQEIIIYYKEEKYVIEDYETPAAIILNQGIRNNHWGKTLNTVDPLSTKTKKENKNVPML